MVGFLIATHGGFARGILDSIELIAGKQERIDTISILHETSIDAFGKELTDKIVELDDGEGVVVFCDLLLASPYNQATMSYRALQGKHEYRILSGAQSADDSGGPQRADAESGAGCNQPDGTECW